MRSFGFGGYRSFGDNLSLLPGVSKINLVAGSNNSGKSNVLRFVEKHYTSAVRATAAPRSAKWEFEPLDDHQGEGSARFRFALGLELDSEEHQALRENNSLRTLFQGDAADAVDRLLTCECLTRGTDVAWFTFTAPQLGGDLKALIPEELSQCLQQGVMHKLARGLTGNSGGSLKTWTEAVFKALVPNNDMPSETHVVPAIRQITTGSGEDFSGTGIIDRLARLQNPDVTQQSQREQFGKINGFLRWVLGDDEATIEIPYQRDTILVHHGGRVLPLTNLGTGVHEVVILAAASTVLQDAVVCIEEPELHLHPVLQRKLLQYLDDETGNQYFISTHSAHLLDERRTSIYHVQHVQGRSLIDVAVSATDRFTIAWDLGYRASDLLQTNCVIWVEGPSDRIYLRHWIQYIDSDLVEGLHYSIMFYGGRLLSHLSADDPEVDKFISLRRLNRHLCVLMDSDMRGSRSTVGATKLRVSSEIRDAGGLAWITAGREIENYLSSDLRKTAFSQLRADFGSLVPTNRYQDALRYRRKNTDSLADGMIDKVKLAAAITEQPADLSVLDLRDRVRGVVEFIQEANKGRS